MFGGLTSALTQIYEFIVSLPLKIAQSIQFLFEFVVDGIVSFFTDPLGSIIGFFQDLLNFLGTFVDALGSMISNVLKSMFVPSDSFIDDNLDTLYSTFSSKLNTQDYQDLLNSMNAATRMKSGASNINVTIWGSTVTIVDFSWFVKYQPQINGFVRGTMFVLLVIYNLNMLYKLVRRDELTHSSENVNKGGGSR